MKASVVTAETLPHALEALGMWLGGGVWAHTGAAGDWVTGLGVRNEAVLCVCGVDGGGQGRGQSGS